MTLSKLTFPAAAQRSVTLLLCLFMWAAAWADRLPVRHSDRPQLPDSVKALLPDSAAVNLGTLTDGIDSIPAIAPVDSVASPYDVWTERDVEFNPDPTRAVWMSALCPGLGQIYNRRYWKLPIVIGAYMGLGYATSWNNNMLSDYTRAYRDLMDSDPGTNSYMNFFPPTTSESDLDKKWLTNVLQSRKNFYRRNRDLCIIAMVGVYFVAMVDAYVDASLSHFDISNDLSMDWNPIVIKDDWSGRPGLGLACAITF